MQWFNFGFALFVGLNIFRTGICQSYDATLKDGTQGKDVVDAVIRKLGRAAIFPQDQGFLKRLALVESGFGNSSDTYRPGYNGGIWHVDEIDFEATKDVLALQAYYDETKQKFGITWDDVTWADLRKPLFSAIAVRLFLRQKTTEAIPSAILAQASYWIRHYKPNGDINRFEEEVRDVESKPECHGVGDVCIVMDGSGSILRPNFQKAIEFSIDLVETFTLDPVIAMRVGYLVFATTVDHYFDLDNTMTKEEMITKLKQVRYPEGATATGDGIVAGLEYFKKAVNRVGIPKIMLTFTDGESNSGIQIPEAVAMIKDERIISYAIGIGAKIYDDELKMIAYGIEEMVKKADDYNALPEITNDLNFAVCQTPQTLEPNVENTTSGVLEPSERRYYAIVLSTNGITISISTNSSFLGWYSYSEPNPNSAIYDGIITSNIIYIPGPAAADGRVLRDDETKHVYVTVQGASTDESLTEYAIHVGEGYQIPSPSPETTQIPTSTEVTTEATSTEVTKATSTEATTETIPQSTEEIIENPETTTTNMPTSPTTTTQTDSTTVNLRPENPSVNVPDESSTLSGALPWLVICCILNLLHYYL